MDLLEKAKKVHFEQKEAIKKAKNIPLLGTLQRTSWGFATLHARTTCPQYSAQKAAYVPSARDTPLPEVITYDTLIPNTNGINMCPRCIDKGEQATLNSLLQVIELTELLDSLFYPDLYPMDSSKEDYLDSAFYFCVTVYSDWERLHVPTEISDAWADILSRYTLAEWECDLKKQIPESLKVAWKPGLIYFDTDDSFPTSILAESSAFIKTISQNEASVYIGPKSLIVLSTLSLETLFPNFHHPQKECVLETLAQLILDGVALVEAFKTTLALEN